MMGRELGINSGIKLNVSFAFIVVMQLHYFISMSRLSGINVVAAAQMVLFSLGVILVFAKYMLLSNRIRKTKLLLVAILTLLSLIIIFLSGGMTVSKMILYALILKGVSMEDCMKYFLKADLVSLFTIAGASAIGLIGGFWSKSGGKVLLLGFNNANTLAALLYTIIMIDLCLNYNKVKFIWWKGILFTVFLLLATQSRAPTLSLICTIVLVALEKSKVLNCNNVFFRYSFMLAALLSMFVAINYKAGHQMWSKVNLILSWRPHFFHRYYTLFPISIMGNNFDLSDIGPLDNAYLMLIYKYGLIFFFVYAVIFYFVFKWSVQENNRAYFVVAAAFVAYFFIEYSPILINYCIPICYFWVKFWKDMDKRKNEDKSYNSSI